MVKTYPMPAIFNNIPGDDRTNEEIISGLEAMNVWVPSYVRKVIADANESVPPVGTVYRLSVVCGDDLPLDRRSGTEQIFAAVSESERVGRPPLRAALLLQERLFRERLWANIVVMNEPVDDCVLALSREDGQSYILAFNAKPGDNWPCKDVLFTFLALQPLQG